MNYNVNRNMTVWLYLTLTNNNKIRFDANKIQCYYEKDNYVVINLKQSVFTVKETIKEIDDLLTKVEI